MFLLDEKERPLSVKYLPLSSWKKKVRKKLSRKEARLLIDLQERYTVISPVWIEELPEPRRTEIIGLTRKALKLGLLGYLRLNLPERTVEAAIFPIKRDK